MTNFTRFTSDNINIFLILIDCSKSMEERHKEVIKGLESFKKSFKNFPEVDSIRVSLTYFNDEVKLGKYKPIKNMKIDHYYEGGTWLNYAILEAAENLRQYIDEVYEETKIIPRATFIVLSDGDPCGDPVSENKGRETIRNLNLQGITTAFVACGNMGKEYGKQMEFMSTIKVKDIEHFFGKELSESCKEQSRSLSPLGSSFFSQVKSSGESLSNYSQTTAQALEDEDWFNQ